MTPPDRPTLPVLSLYLLGIVLFIFFTALAIARVFG